MGGSWGNFPEARLKMIPDRGQGSGLRAKIWPFNHKDTKNKVENFLGPSALPSKSKVLELNMKVKEVFRGYFWTLRILTIAGPDAIPVLISD